MELRKYQHECCGTMLRTMATRTLGGASKWIIQMATGLGKTVVFADFLKKLPSGQKALILAHRTELINQAKEKLLESGFSDSEIDCVQGSEPNENATIWVASVQTLQSSSGARLLKISPSVIIVDECHHSVAESYQTVLAHYEGVPVFGFTATPCRGEKGGTDALLKLFSGGIIYRKSLLDGIKESWLCDIVYYRICTGISLDAVQARSDDFDTAKLSKSVNVHARNQACVEAYLKLGGGKAVCFAVSTQHACNLQEEFARNQVRCGYLDAETSAGDRKKLMADFAASALNDNFVIVNCCILTEGWDCPSLKMVVLARPTTSAVLYSQMVGRVTRLFSGKAQGIVLDIVDNCNTSIVCSLFSSCLEELKQPEAPEFQKEGLGVSVLKIVEAEKKQQALLEIERVELETRAAWEEAAKKEYLKLWYSVTPTALRRSMVLTYVCAELSDTYLVYISETLALRIGLAENRKSYLVAQCTCGVSRKDDPILMKNKNLFDLIVEVEKWLAKNYPKNRQFWDIALNQDLAGASETMIERCKKAGIQYKGLPRSEVKKLLEQKKK